MDLGNTDATRWFAPHTRGSTSRMLGILSALAVCPAHAGVYRMGAGPRTILASLPRTRGGLPLSFLGASTIGRFAPHTRGSTLSLLALPRRLFVCPAHAGVYRNDATERIGCSGLPRTRGGLPAIFQHCITLTAFAPHTRGSTRRDGLADDYEMVCPAHAGVYRLDPTR